MKKQELKQIIKPLIKECLKEVLIEEGFTKMLSESLVIEKQQLTYPVNLQEVKQETKPQKTNLLEARKKMLDEIGMNGFDAFAGTAPLVESSNQQSGVSVTGRDPNDPGVDISRLMSGKLKSTFNALNGKKEKSK